MKAGDTLKNGTTVIDCNEEFVLALRTDAHHPYVTWALGPDGDTFWGHYHFTLEEAVADFKSRSRGIRFRLDGEVEGA